MADCECLPGCPFFNDKMKNMPGTAAMFKNKYCQGSSLDCARHIVFKTLGKSAVPGDLFPNQVERAQSLVGHAA
jgi:hypothetical protein